MCTKSSANLDNMEIVVRERSLFEKWSQTCPDLVCDGVVDGQAYLKADPQVLLVLKEVNDKNGGGWDLRKFIRNGARGQTWNNVTRWMTGIRNLDRDLPWSEVKKVGVTDRREKLRSLCVMNLKKSPGGTSSNAKEIHAAALKYRSLINSQFNLYNPDLVICGGTAKTFSTVINYGRDLDWKRTRRGVRYCEPVPGQHIVDYFHPQARYRASMLYYCLVDAVREIKGYT